jgi:tetratricopeptide (TPR) repeat protein
MGRKFILCIPLPLILTYNLAYADIANRRLCRDIFLEGNKLYEAGDYINAISLYETLITSFNVKNSILYYNLGNAYYRINDIGKAVLNYERALRLSPSDEDIRYNLKFIYSKILNENIYPNIFLNVLSFFSQTTLLYLSLIFSILSSIFISLTLIKNERIFKHLALSATVLFIISFMWLISRVIFIDKVNWGIIVENNVEVKTAPSENAPTGFIVPAGKKVILLTVKDKWIAVKLMKENFKGWVLRKSVEKI